MNSEAYSAQLGTAEAGKTIFIPAKEKTDIFETGRIFRVCAYCRVSTDSDEQMTSFELQKEHYRHLVGQHPNWDLQHIFADEGISATSTKNRDEFNAMISDCMAGKYDLILTKSVSRFARNLVDCITIVRMLKNHNPQIGVYFETDSLFTLSKDSELMLSFLATFAQEESVKKSESMNWSLKERFKTKKLLTPELYGYRRPRDAVGNYVKYGAFEIEESEAEVIKFIFNSFLAGFSTKTIASILTEIGCRTKTGSTSWNEGSVGYILRNERYCGNILTWKSFTSDIFEHKKQKNRQNRDQYLYTNVHTAIVSPEQFEAAQVLLENKRHGYHGGMPIIHVIGTGVFSGYVPINHHRISDDPIPYFEASKSVKIDQKEYKIEKKLFSSFDLSGYQVVRNHFLSSRIEMPCVTLCYDKIIFNRYCLKNLYSVSFIQLLLHPTERKIALRPCNKDDVYSISWNVRVDRPGATKAISCPYFCKALYMIMEWNPQYSYKCVGTPIINDKDRIIIFNINEAMPQAVIENDVDTGNSRKKERVNICPYEWGDSFGEEFYDFSIDNKLYYLPDDGNRKYFADSTPMTGQLPFPLLSKEELEKEREQIKQNAGT